MNFLADLAGKCGANSELVTQIKEANTARHVSELIDKSGLNSFYDNLCKEVYVHLTKYSQSQLKIRITLLDFDGKIIGNYPKDEK
jgi:cobalt-precorrin-5B (C1)-methyltransferase